MDGDPDSLAAWCRALPSSVSRIICSISKSVSTPAVRLELFVVDSERRPVQFNAQHLSNVQARMKEIHLVCRKRLRSLAPYGSKGTSLSAKARLVFSLEGADFLLGTDLGLRKRQLS